jgi:hypothetical protein
MGGPSRSFTSPEPSYTARMFWGLHARQRENRPICVILKTAQAYEKPKRSSQKLNDTPAFRQLIISRIPVSHPIPPCGLSPGWFAASTVFDESHGRACGLGHPNGSEAEKTGEGISSLQKEAATRMPEGFMIKLVKLKCRGSLAVNVSRLLSRLPGRSCKDSVLFHEEAEDGQNRKRCCAR